MSFERFSGGRRVVTLRSALIWQTDLALAAWAAVCAAAATYYQAKPPDPGVVPFGMTALQGVGILFAAGFLVGLALRSLFLRWDFRFVTDERTYFFAHTGREAIYCPRGAIRSIRHQADGIYFDLGCETVRLGEDCPMVLIAVENLLARWGREDRKPWGRAAVVPS